MAEDEPQAWCQPPLPITEPWREDVASRPIQGSD